MITPITHSMTEVARRLFAVKHGRQSVYDAINSGELRSYKVKNRRYVSEQACLDFIRAREAEERAQEVLRRAAEMRSQDAEAAQPSG